MFLFVAPPPMMPWGCARCGTSVKTKLHNHAAMILQRLFQFSTALRSTLSLQLQRNIGFTAVVFNKTKNLDPIQKLFLDKIRDYDTKSKKTGGVVDAGPEYQKNLEQEITKLQRLYGGGDLEKFPDFKFEEPKFDEVSK
ncbi:ATP synthase-coupling factor 6, mitochondrial [Narcine bancroftii]|uniref:ATP synthase-coupling factor 6, mitochondrial n=1 Tax=Narcine bancroftii TaxID=1343680 RepID=UPI0038316E5E